MTEIPDTSCLLYNLLAADTPLEASRSPWVRGISKPPFQLQFFKEKVFFTKFWGEGLVFSREELSWKG